MYTCMYVMYMNMSTFTFQEPGGRVRWWRPFEWRWLLKGMWARGRLQLWGWVEEHLPKLMSYFLEVSLHLVSVSSWYPITYSLVILIIIIIIFNGSILCQALSVSHRLSRLIPAISLRRRKWGTESLDNLLSLVQLEVVKSRFEPRKYGRRIYMLDH